MKKAISLVLAMTMLLSSLVFAPATVAETEDPVVSRFAVVSDVHTNPKSTTMTIDRLPNVFKTAYAYAKEQGGTIDAFVFNGDSIDGNQTSAGYSAEDEWKLFLEGVRDNVKKEESQVLFTLARTHDIYDGDGNYFYVEDDELNKLIAEYLGTDGSIIPTADWGYGPHLTEVNGVPVITLSNDMDNGILDGTDDDDNADNSYHDCEDWLDEQLSALVAKNPNRPIFVVFHYPETGKLGWTQRWGQNSLRDTLNKYPQVITMNAHVHWDPRLSDSITQDQFTEVYDGAIRDAGGPNATTVNGGSSDITSYSIVEVTKSGAVTIKYIDPDTGKLLLEANGTGEVLEYTIEKAWDKSTWQYTDEAKFAVDKATFAEDASITLEDGTLTFDRADSEHPIIRYRVDVSNGETTQTQYVFSQLYDWVTPETYSTTLQLKTGVDYTITVTAIDGIYRESANTLTLTGNVNDPEKILVGKATAVTEKPYSGNGEQDGTDYPDFKTYSTNIDAANITNWGISDIEDLKAWSEFSKTNNCQGLTFHLENDIDMKDEIFNMIGSLYVPFKGTFDGHLHTVSNLFIDDTSGMGTGFFVYTVDATIRNFGIENGLVRGHVSNRKYENTTYKAGVTKRSPFIDVIGVGSIAGRADSTSFYHVWNGANVTYREDHMPGFTNPCFGGLVGRSQNACTFVGCYNTGDVHGLDRASGITNWAQSSTSAARISNCFNLGSITCTANYSTEAIGRYNTVSSTDNSYFNYNNYYLEGSADVASNRSSSSGYTAVGAEEAIALTAEEVKNDLANLLNANAATGYYLDTATWATGEDGVPYIESVSDSEENGTVVVKYLSDYDANSTIRHYLISSEAELNQLATLSKSNNFSGYTFTLTQDIDMSNTTNFAMIGAGDNNATTSFAGTFDGAGHTISNLKINDTEKVRGLFISTKNATIKNFTLKNANVQCGRYSAIVIGSAANTVVENIHVTESCLNPTDDTRTHGGLIGYLYAGNGGACKITNCSVENSTLDCGPNGGVGGLIGEMCDGVVTNCYVLNNTIKTLNRSGILIGYSYRGTVTGCYTYGNTFTAETDGNTTYPSGVVVGQVQTGTTTVKNSVFCEADWDVYGYLKTDDGTPSISFENCYTLNATASAATVSTQEELTSGELAYLTGMAMKSGNICFADEDNKAAICYTYIIDNDTTEYRYTDYAGALIGDAVTVDADDFLGWTVTAGDKDGDKVYTAEYGEADVGSYPITDFENRTKATKFTVSNAEELCALATLSKSNTFEGYTITMLNDIDMSSVSNFAMIGSADYPFKGTFDSANNTVFNMAISGSAYQGMFSYVQNATIQDLVIEDAVITAGYTEVNGTKFSYSGIVAGQALGTTTFKNVRVRYSTLTGYFNIGGIIGTVDGNGSYTIENCLVEGSTIDGLTNNTQAAGGFVGGTADHVTLKNCAIISSVAKARRSVGLVAGYAKNTVIDGLIAYGNTFNCGYGSAGLIAGQLQNGTDTSFKNVVIYNTKGARCTLTADTDATTGLTIPKNSTEFWLFGYTQGSYTAAGENVFTTTASDTSSKVTVTSITKEQVKSGEIAYTLGWAVENNNLAFPDEDTKAAVRYTYTVNGGEYAVRYTDSTGTVLGSTVTLPDGSTASWTESDDADGRTGDKILATTMDYDKTKTYPISQFAIYSEALNFTVSTAEDFKTFADLVNAKKIGSTVTILQTADIDLTDYPNVQVGSESSAEAAFAGTYNGRNHKISNYTLNISTLYQGMFKGLSGTIKNLVIEKANVTANSHSAILVGEIYGTSNLIENVHIKDSTMKVNQRRGAILLYGYRVSGDCFNIKNCTISGCTLNVGNATNAPGTALLVIKADSTAQSTVENTYVFNNIVNASYDQTCGDLIGCDGRNVKLINCASFGNTHTGKISASNIYGLIAENKAANSINNCYTDQTALTKGSSHSGSNNYAGVTATELADGSLAYKLQTNKATTDQDWIQKDYPQVKQLDTDQIVSTFQYMNGTEVFATLYTDYEGNAIGEVTATPTKAGSLFEKWVANEDNTAMIAQFVHNYNVNNDEGVNLADVVCVLRKLVGYEVTIDEACADIDENGYISIYDAVLLLRYVVNLK